MILKWVLPTDDETDRDQALAVRDAIVEERVRALLPSLWLFEVANTLGRKIPDSASKLTRLLVDLSIPELTPDTRWLETALELMKTCNVAFYDASYHATAICTGGVFITADGRYERRVRERGHIILLDSWRLVGA